MFIKYLIAVVMILLMSGCASSAPSIKFMKYTDETFAPTANVEVLRAKPIQRNFIELVEVSVRLKKSIEEDAVLYLKKKAMSVGADAIVILDEVSDGLVAVPIENIYAVVDRKYLIGTCNKIPKIVI